MEGERVELLELAGRAACRRGEIARAVTNFLAAGAVEEACKIIVEAGKKYIGRGDWHTVDLWLSKLSEADIHTNPWLILYKAQIEVARGRIYTGENWINHALGVFAGQADQTGLAESRLLKAKILRCQGRYEDSLDLLLSALPGLPPDETGERFDPLLETSYSMIMCGLFAEAEEVLTTALAKAEQRGDSVLMSYFYEGLGNVYFAWGYPDRSLYYFRRGIAVSPDRKLRNHYFQDAVGPIYQDWGDLDRALEYLQQSVAAKEHLGLTESLPSAYLQLGDVLLDLGDSVKAEVYFRKALAIMEDHGGDHFIHVLLYLSLAVCLGVQGRFVDAEALVEKARKEGGNQSRYIIILFRSVEAFFLLQTGNITAAHTLLQMVEQAIETFSARKIMCITFSALALIGILQENQKDTEEYLGKALELAAEMNYVRDYLVAYETYQPLLYLGLERGIQVRFLQGVMVRLGETAVPLLHKVAGHSDPSVRLRAVNPLAQIGGQNAPDILEELINDENPEVSGLARRVLHRKKGTAQYPTLLHEEKAAIRLELLGPARIYAGNTDITHTNWVRSKSRDLLLFLAHVGSPADKDKIIDAFWPEVPPKQANALFHTTLHNLRRILETQCGRRDLILCRGSRYYLLPGSTFTDKQHYQELLAAAGNDTHPSEPSVASLEEAVALYRGDYLQELDYPWSLPEQEYLRQLHNKARNRLSLWYLARHDYPQAIIHLERLVLDNPFTEEYYSHLLTAYCAIGDIQAVNRKYRELKSILSEELGLQPSKKIRELYNRLIAGN